MKKTKLIFVIWGLVLFVMPLTVLAQNEPDASNIPRSEQLRVIEFKGANTSPGSEKPTQNGKIPNQVFDGSVDVGMAPGETKQVTNVRIGGFHSKVFYFSTILEKPDFMAFTTNAVRVGTLSGTRVDFTLTASNDATIGSHVIRVKYSFHNGGAVLSEEILTVNLTIATAPTADFTGSPTSGTAPLTVNFTDQSSGNITSRSWNFGDGGTSTQQSPSHAYANAGTYTISLTVNGPGGSDTKTRNNYITVNPSKPTADFTASPTSGTVPFTVNFTDWSSGSITSRSWDFGDGQSSTQQNPSHTYQNVGSYTVKLTVTGPGGSDTKTMQNYIVVMPKTSAVVNLTFRCDMTLEIVSKRFNPASDRLSVRGSFNNWSNLDVMQPIAANAMVYATAVKKFWSIGDSIQYKFAYETARGTSWENDANRRYVLTPANINTESGEIKRSFNDLDSTKVTAQPATIKFAVDVKNAVDANGRAFASIQNVILAGNTAPLQWPGNGWPDSDRDKVIFLNDGGTHGDETANDGVWSKDIALPKFTALKVEYLYGANWGLSSNNGNNANESVFAKNHVITLTSDLLSAKVRNKFGVMGETQLVDVIKNNFPAISLSPQAVNVGEVKTNTEKQFFVMLSNTGNADLIITDIKRTSGTDEFSLKYSIPLPVTIRKNDPARNVIFAFAPKSLGEKEAEFTFFSNDPANTMYGLKLRGTGTLGVEVSSKENLTRPSIYALYQNYPNPFNPETDIKYQIPKATHVVLEILNLLGKRVALLVDQHQHPGSYIVRWNGQDSFGKNMASGTYLYKLQTEDYAQVRKLMLLR